VIRDLQDHSYNLAGIEKLMSSEHFCGSFKMEAFVDISLVSIRCDLHAL
jgi:hypothetical protein